MPVYKFNPKTHVPVLAEKVPGLGDCLQEDAGKKVNSGSVSWKVLVSIRSSGFPTWPSKYICKGSRYFNVMEK